MGEAAGTFPWSESQLITLAFRRRCSIVSALGLLLLLLFSESAGLGFLFEVSSGFSVLVTLFLAFCCARTLRGDGLFTELPLGVALSGVFSFSSAIFPEKKRIVERFVMDSFFVNIDLSTFSLFFAWQILMQVVSLVGVCFENSISLLVVIKSQLSRVENSFCCR